MLINASESREFASEIAARRRRGPKPHVAPSLDVFRARSGRPFRLRDLAAMTSLSKPKILADARAGYLRLSYTSGGMALVRFEEARRYVRSLGLS